MKSSKRSPKITFDMIRYFILFGLLGGLFIHSFWNYGIMNQVIGFLLPKASAQVPFVSSNNGLIPDWSRMKFQLQVLVRPLERNGFRVKSRKLKVAMEF